MRLYQEKLVQDFQYKFLPPAPSFKNVIAKMVILHTVRLKTIRDVRVIQSITLGEVLFSQKPKFKIKEIKYRFKEKYFMAKTEMTLHNNNLESALSIFSLLYIPLVKRLYYRSRLMRPLFYFSRNNFITFLFTSKVFSFLKTEIPGSLRNPMLLRFFLSKPYAILYKGFNRIFSIFALTRFVKLPIFRFGLRKRMNKFKKFRTVKNILKTFKIK